MTQCQQCILVAGVGQQDLGRLQGRTAGYVMDVIRSKSPWQRSIEFTTILTALVAFASATTSAGSAPIRAATSRTAACTAASNRCASGRLCPPEPW